MDWRDELANKLISIQKSDGSWVNTNNRWWEADPVLVTSYLSLIHIWAYSSLLAASRAIMHTAVL